MYGIRNLTTWNPWGPLERLQAEFERGAPSAVRVQSTPRIDVWSEGDDLRLRALVPGVRPEDLEVHVQGDTLTLRATVHGSEGETDHHWLRREREAGSFTRSLQLPFAIEADAVKARMAHGVLEMELPRAASDKPRRIPVQHS